MNKKFKKIWKTALPYQDVRDDKGHAEVVTEYAFKICDVEDVNRDVVIPAAMLHDIGWSKLTKPERMLIFDKNVPKEERLKMRYRHQNEGTKMARDILEKLKYGEKLIPKILEIISQHDTRAGFISENEGAMRDADKLWRYDRRGFVSDRGSTSLSIVEHLSKLHNSLKDSNFFRFESSIKLARKLLNELEKEFAKK